jgi:hypothetical protein
MRRRGPFFLVFVAVVSLAAIIVVAGALWKRPWITSSSDPRGPVASRAQWPSPIQRLLDDLEREGLKEESIEVYRLGFVFDDAYFVRIQMLPPLMALLKARWRLKAIDSESRLVTDFLAQMPVAWRDDVGGSHPSYYASASWLAGEEGERYVVMHDESQTCLFVWYSFNF